MMRFFSRQQAPQSPPMPLCDSHTLDSQKTSAWISLGNEGNVPQLPEVPELAPIRFSRMNFEVYTGWKPDKQVVDERADDDLRALHIEQSLRSLQSMDSFESSDSLTDSLTNSLPSFASTESFDSVVNTQISHLGSHSSHLSSYGSSSHGSSSHGSNNQLGSHGATNSHLSKQPGSNSNLSSYLGSAHLNHHGSTSHLNTSPSGVHTLRKTKSTPFERPEHESTVQPWELSEDEYNAYKLNALKKIKNRKRQEGKLPKAKKHKHRPPRISIPASPPKLQLISPDTPTLASAPPSQPPPKLPLPSLADYTRMRTVTGVAEDASFDNSFSESAFEDAHASFSPPSPLTASMNALETSSEGKGKPRLLSRPMKAFRAVWDADRAKLDEPGSVSGGASGFESHPDDSATHDSATFDQSTTPDDPKNATPNIATPKSTARPNDLQTTQMPGEAATAPEARSPNPSNAAAGSPNPARTPSQTLLPQTAVAPEPSRLGGNNWSDAASDANSAPERPPSSCEPISTPSEHTRDVLDDPHSSDFSDDFIQDTGADDSDTDTDDMNGHPRRVSSLSSSPSIRSVDAKGRDKPTKDSRELHQLSSITKGLVRNSPFFDLDENRKSGPRASATRDSSSAKGPKTTDPPRDVIDVDAGEIEDTDPVATAADLAAPSTIKVVSPPPPQMQQRGSSLRAGRTHPDSSTDSVDSFKSTKEIPREYAPESPVSSSQISTPKKESAVRESAVREPKDDPDNEDFSFVDHSDSVQRSGHKPWDRDDPKMRRSILAEFESDLNDLLLLSHKQETDDLDFKEEPRTETREEQEEQKHEEVPSTAGTTNTIIPVNAATNSTTTTSSAPIAIPNAAASDVASGSEPGAPSVAASAASGVSSAASPTASLTSPTSSTYMDAPPPPPTDPMPSTPGEALDQEGMQRKKAPSVASTASASTSASTIQPTSTPQLNANKRGLRSVSSSASLKLRTSIFPFKGPASAGVATTPETASMTGSMYSSSIYSGSTLVRDSPAVSVARNRMKSSLKSFPILYYAVTLSGPVNVKYNIEGATPSGQYGILSLPTAPHPWEKPPEDLALRGVWFLRLVVDSGTNTAGGFLTDKLFVPRDVWSLSSSMSSKVLDKRLYITDEYCRAICEFMAFADSPKGGAKPQSNTAQSIDDALERLDARIENLSRHQYVMKADGDLIVDLGAHSPDSDDTLTPLASSVPSESTIHPVMSHPTPSTTPMTSNNRRSSDIGLLANHIFSKKEEKPKEPKEDKDNSSSKLFKRFQRKISLANNHSNENLSLPSEKTNGKAEGTPVTPIDPHHDYGARYFNAISALYSDMEALAHYRFLLQNEARDAQAAKGYSQAVIIEAIDSCFAFSNTICRIILQDILAMLEVYLEGGKSVLAD
ncbi:hypothetical protein CJU89_5286 [Yarrowia sp. B02]|nr:hypothetical protein CJU89_5286 [Yarrowia sp. B02]